jgi:uncharacterized protein (DUF1778 family)
MVKNKQFPITPTEEERRLIEEGAINSRRSISNFLIWSALEQVKTLKKENSEDSV